MNNIFLTSKVTSEVEAYILGFLYADGYVTGKTNDKYYALGMTLKFSDNQIVHDISKHFNNVRIIIGKNRCQTGEFEIIKFQVYDVRLIERLIKLGLTPNKTYEDSSFVFNNVPDDLKYHFIRGYFDGDGSVGIYEGKCRFSIVSCNKKLLYSILDYIKKDLNTSSNIKNENNRYYRILISGNPLCKKIENLLYEDATIYLQRKRDVFIRIPELYIKKYNYKGISYYKKNRKWLAVIYVNKNEQKRYLGSFDTELEAVEVYNTEARKLGKKEQEIKWEYH